MSAPVLIVGQGLAGTLLAWELEQAGLDFEIVDAGGGATLVAGGMINPVTGQRFVKSWQVETCLPAARACYRELELAWGCSLWRPLRVRRLWSDASERRRAEERLERGLLAPYVRELDAEGMWIEQAAHVDVAALVEAGRQRWQRNGRWRAGTSALGDAVASHSWVIDCTGASAARDPAWRGLPWALAKGQIVTVETADLVPDILLNAGGYWLLPLGNNLAKVGATYEREATDLAPSVPARETLTAAASRLLAGRPFAVVDQVAGLRVALPDRRPVLGSHPSIPRLGLLNGLGSKGALWAPSLARQWGRHIRAGTPFDPALDVARWTAIGSKEAR